MLRKWRTCLTGPPSTESPGNSSTNVLFQFNSSKDFKFSNFPVSFDFNGWTFVSVSAINFAYVTSDCLEKRLDCIRDGNRCKIIFTQELRNLEVKLVVMRFIFLPRQLDAPIRKF